MAGAAWLDVDARPRRRFVFHDRPPPVMADLKVRLQRRLPRSSARSCCLIGRPPPYPVSLPLDPMTRWQGMTIGSGLRPLARPTARHAALLPMRDASSPYEIVSP